MYALSRDNNRYIIPLLLAVPDSGETHPSLIYIHPDGKEQGISVGGTVEKLVQQGFAVAVPDLLGIGETQSHRKYSGSHGFEAQLIGKSIVGIHAGDISYVVNFLKKNSCIVKEQIHAVAYGEECPALLHAAAYDLSISGILLVEPPLSYFDITQTRFYKYSPTFNWGVAGALTTYDLPDLAACIAPRKLAYMGLLNGERIPLNRKLIMGKMALPISVYAKSCPGNLKIMPILEGGIVDFLTGWLKK
jgi:hypothetical protein